MNNSNVIICGTDLHENKMVNAIATGKEEIKMKNTEYNKGGFKDLFFTLKSLANAK